MRVLAGAAGACRRALIRRVAAAAAEALLRRHHRALTRFDSGSELSTLNADPSPRAGRIGPDGGRHRRGPLRRGASGGLVDPTLLAELEEAGYARTRAGSEPAPLSDALRAAPLRRPAAPQPGARWRGRSSVSG